MSTRPPETVEAEFVHQTKDAVLDKNEKDRKIWLPKSQMEMEPEDPQRGDVVEITSDEHFLVEKGLA